MTIFIRDLPRMTVPRRAAGTGGLLALLALGLAACASPSGPTAMAQGTDELKASPETLERLAAAADEAGDNAGAARLYRRALAAGGEPLAAHLGLGHALLETGALDEAEKEFNAAAALGPTRVEARLGRARIALMRGSPSTALAILAEVPADGQSADLLDLRAVAFDLLGRHKDAQAAYAAALGKAPNDRRIRNNYGLSLILTRDYAEAVGVLRPFADDPAATARNRQNLALALGLSGDMEGARAVAQQDLDPSAVENNLAFYERLGAVGGARPAQAGSGSP